ncbi:MAG: thiamine diphosphokinase [Bacillota bacterium]
MKTVIISSGNIENYSRFSETAASADFVICADGGIRHAKRMSVIPDVIIGDLDSAADEHIEYYKGKGVSFIRFDSDKDKTDTQLCLEYALDFSKEIIMLGSLGSRIDHALANISLLKLALDRGIKACIMNEKNEIYMISDEITIKGRPGEYISLLPASTKAEGISISGALYELNDAVMELGNPYGVSNEFVKEEIYIKVLKGYLLVIKASD